MLLYLTAVVVYLARTHGPAVVNHPAIPKVALGTTAACSVGVVGYYGYHYLNSPIPYPATPIALDSHRTALMAMLDDLERPLFPPSTRVICSWTKDPPSPLLACPPLSEPLPQTPTHTFLFSDPLPNSTTVQKNIRLPGRSFNSGMALDVDVAPASAIFFTHSSPAADVPAPRHAAKPILVLTSALVLAMIALNAFMNNGSSSDPGLLGKVFEAIMSTIDENEKMTIPPALPPPVTFEGDGVLNIPAVPNDVTVPNVVQAPVLAIDIQANATTAEAEHTSATKPDDGSGVLADHATASLPELPEMPKALDEVVKVDGTEHSDVQALVTGLPVSIPAITEEEVTQDTPIALDDVLDPDIAQILDFTSDGSAPAILPATVAEAEDASTAKVDDGSMVLADQIMTPLPALPEALATPCEVVNDLSEVPSQGSAADPSVQAPIGLLVPIPAIIEAELVQDTPAVVDDVKALDIIFAIDVDILPVPAAEVKDVSINNDSALLAGQVMKALLPVLPESLAAPCEVVDDLSEIPSQDAAEPSAMQALVTGSLFPIPAIIEEVPSLDASSHPSYPTAQRPWYRIAHHPFPTRHPIVPNGRETRGSFRRGLSVLVTIPETRTVNVTRERPWCRTALNPSLARHPAIPNGGETPLQYHQMCGLTLHRGLCVLRAILEELDEDEDGYGDEDDYEDEDDYDESEYEDDEDEYDDKDEYDRGDEYEDDEDEDEEIIPSRPLYRQILNPFLVCHPAVPNGGETPLLHQRLSSKTLHRGLCILIVVPEELEDDDEDLEEDDEDGEGEGSDDAASPYSA